MLTGRSLALRCVLAILTGSSISAAQTIPAAETVLNTRPNGFGLLFAYSNDSSPMLLGRADQQKLLNIGASYSRRLVLNHIVNWQYDGEILPVAFVSNPVEVDTSTLTVENPPISITSTTSSAIDYLCRPSSATLSGSGRTASYLITCTRRWVYGAGLSPVGFQWNFLPHRWLQPLLVGHGGFMKSTEQIPINYAATFNFTFDFGAGFEWYRTPNRSLRFEYRYHHISNHSIATLNPGIDSGLNSRMSSADEIFCSKADVPGPSHKPEVTPSLSR